MDNPKIGQYGGEKPTLTLCGAEAKQPFGKVYGLGGDGYYCVGDVFPHGDWQAELAKLRKEVAGMKTTPRVKVDS